MKILVRAPQGEMKARIENLLPPKKYMARFRKEQKIAAQITKNLERGKQ